MSELNEADAPAAGPDAAREERARDWIRVLTEFPARFAGTDSERRVAEQVADWMRALGVTDITLMPVPGLPHPGLALALHTGLALIACLFGGVLGVALALLALWSFQREFHDRRPGLSAWLPRSPSVNVIGRVGSATPTRRVILTAHIDSTQAGLMFARPVVEFFAAFAQRRPSPGTAPITPLRIPQALILAGLAIALATWLGGHGFLLGLARAMTVTALAVACAATLEWAFASATPGANDNASAVAAMLTCAERLRPGLPADVQLWIVGTGAEEVGCQGMHALLDAHPDWSRTHTFFVNFECLGGGTLHYVRSEGLLARVWYPPALNDLARRVGPRGPFATPAPTDLLAATDGHVPAASDYPTLSLISLESNGVPRNYHRREDTVDAVDMALVVRAADFAAAVAAAALAGEANAALAR